LRNQEAFLWPYFKKDTTEAQLQINAKTLKLLLRFLDSVFRLKNTNFNPTYADDLHGEGHTAYISKPVLDKNERAVVLFKGA